MKQRWASRIQWAAAAALVYLAAGAMDAAALQISPNYQIFSVKAGASKKGELTITNNESSSMTFVTGVKDWYTYRANQKFPTETWLFIEEPSFSLQPGESKKVHFTIKSPKKAVGELMGMITFSNKPGAGMVTMQLSVAIYVSMEGTEKIKGETAAISVQVSTHTQVTALVVNEGNVHLRPRGLVQVFDKDDRLVINAVPEFGKPVFPGVPRAFDSVIKDFRLPPGSYRAVIEFEDADRDYKFPVQEKKFTVNEDGRTGDKKK